MFVNVQVNLDNVSNAKDELLEIPEISIQPGDRVWTVEDIRWVKVEADGKVKESLIGNLRLHDVEVLERENQDASPQERIAVVRSIDNSLHANAKIVTSPLMQPENGNEVILEVVETSSEEGESNTAVEAKENTSSRKSEAGNVKKTQGAIRS